MNWTRIGIAGVVAGIVVSVANFIMHGLIMGAEYTRHGAFTQEQANPAHLVLVGLCIGVMAALLYAKTHSSWGTGPVAGAKFGFFLGLVFFFSPFYLPLVISEFPYHMGWCWGGIDLIGFVIYGTVIGAIYKKA